MGQGDTLGKASKKRYVDIPAVCSYSCSILLLSLLRIDGEVSPRALGVITRIQEVVGENYVLCYYVGSQEVCLSMSLVTLSAPQAIMFPVTANCKTWLPNMQAVCK
jgi:hypothetical protein